MLTEPSASVAVALIVTEANEVKLALFAGLVILTVGAVFGFNTEITMAADVVTAPLLSVALAAIE